MGDAAFAGLLIAIRNPFREAGFAAVGQAGMPGCGARRQGTNLRLLTQASVRALARPTLRSSQLFALMRLLLTKHFPAA
jgi:hypothetical protein